ncbi:MAG: hypothetical protein WC849_01060 [Candidatus Paceibacterota bacterium]
MENKLRLQKFGNQKPWKIEEVEAGLKHFFEENQRYPTSIEIDKYEHLPSSKSIQRSFGGLVTIRKKLNLENDYDFRKGKHSSERALYINKRNNLLEKKVYEFLVEHYDKPFVHREYLFMDDRRTRADFFVYDSKNGFCIDIFYPSDKRNLLGCLNNKLNKYNQIYMRQYPVIFLQMNLDIDQSVLDNIVKNKKRKLSEGQYLMSWDTFVQFCKSRKHFIK